MLFKSDNKEVCIDKILIIKDDEKLREELKIFLDRNGYDTVILDKFDNPVMLQSHIIYRYCLQKLMGS